MPELVADTCAFIDALGGPVDLVGHDWGGVVAGRSPPAIPSGSARGRPSRRPTQLALNDALAADDDQRERFGYIACSASPARPRPPCCPTMPSGCASCTARPSRPSGSTRRGGAATAGSVDRGPELVPRHTPGQPDDLGLVTVPTDYLWGTEDVAFGRLAAEGSARYVDADYTFVPLDGVGHWVPDQSTGCGGRGDPDPDPDHLTSSLI